MAGGAAFAGQPASVLVHEHVLVDFVGADQIRPGRYDRDEVFRIALPKLEEVRRLGCRRLLECTPNFLGRDPELLARLSDAASLEIWSNTGLYGAADHKFVPAFARSESARSSRNGGLRRRARLGGRDSSRSASIAGHSTR